MRGQATPSALMIAPSLFSLSKDFKRIPLDPAASKKLLAEAGYPDGFEVQMDCPNDRYVNDEQICQAVVGMLARVGIKVDLNAEPKSKFFAAISAAGGYDSSFYLLGWTPATLESFNVFQYIMGCRNPKTNWGGNNVGDYCNPKVDELARKALRAVQRSVLSPKCNTIQRSEAQREVEDSADGKSLNLCEATESFGGRLEVVRTSSFAVRDNSRPASGRG